jgi:hypothetical protein
LERIAELAFTFLEASTANREIDQDAAASDHELSVILHLDIIDLCSICLASYHTFPCVGVINRARLVIISTNQSQAIATWRVGQCNVTALDTMTSQWLTRLYTFL